MVGTDPDGSGGAPDMYELFCDYLGSCAVSWDNEPLPDRPKKRCAGSYHRVQESSTESLGLKRSNAEAGLNEGKVDEPIFKSWHPTQTSNKSRGDNENEREDASAEFLHLTDNTISCSGLNSSSRDRPKKKIRLLNDVTFDLQIAETVQEAPKRPRTAVLQNQECSGQKKRKLSKWEGSYSVIIEWLNYYCISESDEDEVPLINKRTERRKHQKLLEMSLAREFRNRVECASSTSHTLAGTEDGCVGSCSLDPGDNSKFVIVPASRPEERGLPNHALGSHGVSGNQVDCEIVPSPYSPKLSTFQMAECKSSVSFF
uniref:Uncharacterized protein n=1 Tax=Arundo donax TaxID=35708 RepID=A0A0A9HCE3_ARUDO